MTDSDSSTPASDESPASSDEPTGARMMLEPDAVHEETDDPSIDCPACGTTVSLGRVIEEGHCPAYVEGESAETVSDDERIATECTAELSLELVWES